MYLILGGLAVGAAMLGIPLAMSHSHPEFWGAIGWVIGGVEAALLEYRYVRFAPVDLPRSKQALKIGVGLSGLALLLLAFLVLSAQLGAVAAPPTAALAALWAVLIAPVLFACAGLGHASEADADHSWNPLVPSGPATPSRRSAPR